MGLPERFSLCECRAIKDERKKVERKLSKVG